MKRTLLVAMLGLFCTSCAFMNPRNRPLMDFCEKHLEPESTWGQVAAAPVVLPICLVAGVVDTVLVHPLSVIDDAWYDTESSTWEPTGRGYVTECALFPFRAAFTPVVWTLSFASRAVFDVPPWAPGLDRLEQELTDPDHELRMLAVTALRRSSYTGEQVKPATDVMVAACRKFSDDTAFCEEVIARLPGPLTAVAQEYLSDQAQTGKDAVADAALGRLFADCLQDASRADYLARVYDALVKSGAHRAEVYTMSLARFYLGRVDPRQQKSPQALGLYIMRSLAQRNWPIYATWESFRLETALLYYSAAAQVQAMQYEWRVLRVTQQWPWAVDGAFRELEQGRASAVPLLKEHLRDLLKQTEQGEMPRSLLEKTEELMAVQTALDAAETADKLMDAPAADRELFLRSLRLELGKRRQP